ncbi:unnamed protein product, partial [Protopolystoma xenopodis]
MEVESDPDHRLDLTDPTATLLPSRALDRPHVGAVICAGAEAGQTEPLRVRRDGKTGHIFAGQSTWPHIKGLSGRWNRKPAIRCRSRSADLSFTHKWPGPSLKFCLAVALAFAVSLALILNFKFALAFFLDFTFAFAFALAFTINFTFAFALTIVLALVFSFDLALALTFAFAVFLTLILEFNFALALALAVFLALNLD